MQQCPAREITLTGKSYTIHVLINQYRRNDQNDHKHKVNPKTHWRQTIRLVNTYKFYPMTVHKINQ